MGQRAAGRGGSEMEGGKKESQINVVHWNFRKHIVLAHLPCEGREPSKAHHLASQFT